MNEATEIPTSGRVPLMKFLLYFLRLGAFGIGGPIVLASRMEIDLVREKNWIRQEDYLEGLALAQLAPGPLAAQLAMYLGYVRAGIPGATLVGLTFILASFLMVVGISVLYMRFDGLPQLQAVFYGIGAAVVAIMLRSATKLAKSTLKKDRLLWSIAAVLCISTAFTGHEIFWLFLLGGVCSWFLKTQYQWKPLAFSFAAPFFVSIPWITSKDAEILSFFLKSSLFVFGSGLAIVPFLHGGVVDTHHWLNERQFLDAIAVAMITPGPVVITVAFIGYVAGGITGAVLAAVGVFLPVYLMVTVCAPFYRRLSTSVGAQAFVKGVTAAATGAIAGAIYVIGRSSIRDLQTIIIFALVALALWKWKIPEPILVAAAGVIGLLMFGMPFGK